MSRNRAGAARGGHAARLVAGIVLAVALASGVRAQLPPPATEEPQAWPEAETVRMLLRADAAAALADCRVPGICPAGAGSAPASGPAAPARSLDDIRVLAIFGMARSLRVDLNVNGAVLRYQSGRGAPIAGAAVAGAYQLLAIEDACVRLSRDGLERIACLDLGRAHP
ncbi:hypothetical protein EUC41_09365 [Achromobacter denitrificans]|uniref:hypothetical protein n=1 Tax=Achromobacter denitrificans TaxID=32002 RepID=UPI00240D7978|nr:hypothetical protein [Achromobacter denitrificans]MBV2157402.1 hypothetical protein [Achromobacter denitrificans]MDX3880376.1 hypothetical protein [Achromobacter sp.]WFC66506.1 hypothetical protein EUC41_09365 [Achromobacter denitrificans]